MEDFVVRLQPKLERAEQLLPYVVRVAADNIEAALGKATQSHTLAKAEMRKAES